MIGLLIISIIFITGLFLYNFHNKYDSKNKNNPSIVEKKNSDNKKAVKDEVKIKDENVDKKDDVNNDDTTSKTNERRRT